MARLLFAALLVTLSACGGGGSSEGNQPESSISEVPPPSPDSPSDSSGGGSTDTSDSGSGSQEGSSNATVQPGNYASVANCPLLAGHSDAEFKLLFIDLDNAPYFDEIVFDAIENQFQAVAPFSDYFSHFAFYQLELDDAGALGCEATSAGSAANFTCDDDLIHQAILQQCDISDIHGTIKVVIADRGYGAAAGEIIYLGSDSSWADADTALYNLRNLIIHEVGHNFGLADLYDGGTNDDGSAVTGWPSSLSRQWRNLDGPGCEKWCGSFKPASEYTQSASAACHTFDTREGCISYNRDSAGQCTTDDGGTVACCAWSEESEDDYFGSQCAPAWGTENIGLDCLEGTGCYYGGAYGNNSWRPVKSWSDSIMYGAGQSDKFDSASARALAEALRCCGTSDDATKSCASFRADYTAFIRDSQPYKNRIGSCGFSG